MKDAVSQRNKPMSKPIQSIDAVNTDGTTITGINDPTVLKAVQAYVDALNPPASPVIAVGPTPTKVLPQNLTSDYALVPGTYTIDPKATVPANATASIYSLDPKHPATLLLPACWPKTTPTAPDVGVPLREGTILVAGSLTIKDLLTRGAPNVDPQDIILLGSQTGANITASNIQMDGGGFIRGNGGNSYNWKSIQSAGTPRAYFVGLFGSQVNSIVWDNTGSATIKQGGRMVGGSPQGETAVRLMHGHRATITGLTLQAWLYDGKNPWKQLLQDRSGALKGMTGSDKHSIESLDDGSIHDFINCELLQGQPEIGWMQGTRDASEVKSALGLSRWTACKFGMKPRVFAYCKQAQFINCEVGGAVYTATVNP